ncbi:hypothetical protein [Streptomyces cacaoi]|uniref:hypothetical protein n=1 Tax=Streptomyces cacaoi TaxID=1898 RepID=UPI003747BFD7
MAISYQDIVEAKLDLLETAAKSWDSMGRKFGTLGGDYSSHVSTAVDADTWQGYAADQFKSWGQTTAEEFEQAKGEAKGVAALLRIAHETLSWHKTNVIGIRDDAIDEGMDVDSHGRCKMNLDKVAAKKGEKTADKYREDPKARAEVEDEWTGGIKRAVKDAQVADANLKQDFLARGKQPDKGLPDGFNGDLDEQVKQAQVDRAADTFKAIRDGETPSPAKVREADILLKVHKGDPAYNQTLINSLGGPDGLVKTHNRLDDLAYFDDKQHKGSYISLDRGLATSLATATRNPKSDFYDKFMSDMRKAGVKTYDLDLAGEKQPAGAPGQEQKVRGYQSLVSLMKRGGEYDDTFLKETADAIRSAEDKKRHGNPDVWDLYGDFSGKGDRRFAADPLDGILEVMSDKPKVATDYLDPGEGRPNDNLKYLLHDRDWKTVDFGARDAMGAEPDLESPRARHGLGLAIEAGSTGRVPGAPGEEFGKHSEAQARIMHDTINTLDYGHPEGKNGDEDRIGGANELLAEDGYSEMRRPLARALTSYTPDTVDIISGDGPGRRTGQGDALMDGENSQVQNSRSSILRMMRGVSEGDDANYWLLHGSSGRYMAEQLTDDQNAGQEQLISRGAKVGEVFGAINGVGADTDLSQHGRKGDEISTTRVYGYHLLGGLVNSIPVVGDVAQRTVDSYFDGWSKAADSENDRLTQEKVSSRNEVAEDALDRYFEKWSRASGKTVNFDPLQRESHQSFVAGREAAYDALRLNN